MKFRCEDCNLEFEKKKYIKVSYKGTNAKDKKESMAYCPTCGKSCSNAYQYKVSGQVYKPPTPKRKHRDRPPPLIDAKKVDMANRMIEIRGNCDLDCHCDLDWEGDEITCEKCGYIERVDDG